MTEDHIQLKDLVYEGAKKKNLPITDIVLDRISYELSVIDNLRLSFYFIIGFRIAEVCNELKLLRTYGKVSVAGSMVNYCLDITNINPLTENLIFERFLHPQQKHFPNIVIDIPRFQYKNITERLKQKYPELHVYFIAMLPNSDNAHYLDVVNNNFTYKKYPPGLLVQKEKLTNDVIHYEANEYYLVLDSKNDLYSSQKHNLWELEYLYKLQLIINEIGEEYHPYRLPLNDKAVFDFFADGDLDNVFQFDSAGLRILLPQFKPSSIRALALMIAMYRPKVHTYIPQVIDAKFNNTASLYPSEPRVAEILEETYGLLIYAENFHRLSKELAGISYADAELWRKRIIEDKSEVSFIEFSAIFTKGCREHSNLIEKEIASLLSMMAELIDKTFLKAHSFSYSIVGYWGAYYKLYFRAQFDKVFND